MNVNVLGCYVRIIFNQTEFFRSPATETQDQMVFKNKVNAARPATVFQLLPGADRGVSTNKNIFVKIICIMVDVMYETPERDVFY